MLRQLSDESAVNQRWTARRVADGDIGGPVLITRRAGSVDELASLVRAWCEMAIKRDAAGHPGVTRCLEVGAAEDGEAAWLYEVSELVDGASLMRLLRHYRERDEHPPLDVALAVASAAAALLEELAHSGVNVGYAVPDHVVITRDGRAVLERVGVPAERARRRGYCAPELLKKTAADGRTDVWVVGRLLKAVLSGYQGTSARIPARYAKPTKALLQQLLVGSRKRRPSLADARQRIDELLAEIEAPSADVLLASVLAERFRDAADDVAVDVGALRQAGRTTTAADHFYPIDGDAKPLPLLPIEAERDETLSDTLDLGSLSAPGARGADDATRRLTPGLAPEKTAAFDVDKTEAAVVKPPVATLRAGGVDVSSSDEGPGVDLGDVFSDPDQPVRTQITAVTTPAIPQGPLASAGSDGSLPSAEAESIDGLHLDDIPNELMVDDDGLDALPALIDPSPSPFANTPATVLSRAPQMIEQTRVDSDEGEGGGAARSEDEAPPVLRPPTLPRQAEPYDVTRTGVGANLVSVDPASVEDVWAQSKPLPPAPGPDPLGDDEAHTSTDVVELPNASISELADEATAPPAPAITEEELDDGPMHIPPQTPTDPGRDVFASAPDAEAGGLLVVDAPAGAVVHIDGENRGSGRLTVEDVPRTGSIRIRVTLGGHRPWVAEVSLEGQPAAKVTPRLVPA